MEDSKANLFPDPQIHIFVSKIDPSDNNPVIFFPQYSLSQWYDWQKEIGNKSFNDLSIIQI